MSAAAVAAVGGALLSILANANAEEKVQEQKEKQTKLDKRATRRAAIERMLNSGFTTRGQKILDPVDITSERVLGGLGQLGSQLALNQLAKPQFPTGAFSHNPNISVT